MKRIGGALCILSLVSIPTLAGENDTTPWAKVGSWQIAVDSSLGNGCFMVGAYTLGDVVRVGINNENKNGYIAIANSAWASLEIGKEYDLTFEFDGETPWNGTFKARKLGTLTILTASFKDAKFLREFAARPALTICYNGTVVTKLPLTGSFAAMQSLVQCQDKVDAIAGTPSTRPDPFSGGTRRASDPFAQ